MDDRLERIRAVRQQRRSTVAAIELVEQYARAHKSRFGFTDMVDLYLSSQRADTVEELQRIEDQALSYLRRLQTGSDAR